MTYIDCHTHILPDMDDGPADMAEALDLAWALIQAGFTRAVATPHCAQGEPSRAAILERLAELKDELARRQLPLDLCPGAEYALEPDLPQRLHAGELLTLNGSRFLLLEPPAYQPLPPFFEQMIFDLRLCGCYPILAHPERCGDFQKSPGRLYRLIRRGALTQVTLSSLTGALGPGAARAAALFFAAGAVHFLATDAHSAAGRLNGTETALALVEKLGGSGAADLMLGTRPALILQDQLPLLPEPDEAAFIPKFKKRGWSA